MDSSILHAPRSTDFVGGTCNFSKPLHIGFNSHANNKHFGYNMAPKVIDVDPDGTDSETDSKPFDYQIPSAPALDESKTSEVANTPPADPTDNILQQEEVASAHEVSSTAPMITSTEASKNTNALLDEEKRSTSRDDDVNQEPP